MIKKRLNEMLHDRAVVLTILYFPVYLMVWFLAAQRSETPVFLVHCALDDMIPFCRYFVIPYVLWYVYFGGTLVWMLIADRRAFLRTSLTLAIGLTASCIFFITVPTGIDFRPAASDGSDIFAWMVNVIFSIDPPRSVLPSLHCFVAIVMTAGIFCCGKLKGKVGIKLGTVVLCILICMSTVFIKQHSILDFFAAVILCIPCCLLGFAKKWAYIEKTPVLKQ